MAGPTLENGRAGRRGFLHGWLDENWALCSHRFWSESIGRYFVHSAEATAAPTHALLTHGDCIIFIEGPKSRGRNFKSSPCTHRTCSALGTTEWRAQHSKMDELDGGGSCTGGSKRMGPSLPIGSGQGASVVTSYTPPRPPQLRHMLCSPMGAASSLSRGRILKGFAPHPSQSASALAPPNGRPTT